LIVVQHVTGIWWVDETKERNGDYVPLAHAMFSNPVLVIEAPRSKHLPAIREDHARRFPVKEDPIA
jgi:hypothetical protein